jgi:Chitin synthase
LVSSLPSPPRHIPPNPTVLRKTRFSVRLLPKELSFRALSWLRTSDTHKRLMSNQLINDYSESRVDTLHMKNLPHFGKDRYLTTLFLKYFPLFKTQFVRDAHAFTVTPDDWKILLSQRRRWINSTVHNWANLCSWSSFIVSVVSRCISWL